MPTKEETEILQSIITGVYTDFVNIVSKKRSIESNFITEDLGALIFDAKMAKDNYLIDDIKNLKEVINQVVKDLSLKDYKIIKQKRKKNFFTDLMRTVLIMKYDLYSIKENRVCNLINGYINVLLINNKYLNSC
jgi:ClpP class serine protease